MANTPVAAHPTDMSTAPHPNQPRHTDGRFATYQAPETPLELVRADTGRPRDSGQAQDRCYSMAWDSSTAETERASACRQAVHAADIDGRLAEAVPDTDEAQDLLAAGLADDDVVLDAAHDLGPMAYPETRAFGAFLAGAIYDRMQRRLDPWG